MSRPADTLTRGLVHQLGSGSGAELRQYRQETEKVHSGVARSVGLHALKHHFRHPLGQGLVVPGKVKQV